MRAALVGAMLVASMVAALAGCHLDCPTALAEGTLVAQGKDLVLRATTGETNTIIWPSGYSVREDSGSLVLTDRFGSIRAREGDWVRVGGGTGADDVFHGCGDVWIVPSPSPAAP